MKTLFSILFSAIISVSAVSAHAHGDMNGKVIFRTNSMQMRQIPMEWLGGADVAGQDIKKRSIDLVLTKEAAEELAESGIGSIVGSQPKGLDERYFRPQKVEAFLASMVEKYPELVHVEKIGKTNQGRAIYGVRLSTAENVNYKPTILFNGMHHAREIMTAEITTDIISYLAGNFDNPQTPWVRTWLENLAIWVVPQVNPDGNEIVWQSDTWWRKNARGEGSSIWGVDLNRNYVFQWNACGGSSGSKGSDTYRGASAGSEPETQAMMNFVKEKNFAMNVSYHSYSELVIYPYGCQNQVTPENFIVKSVAEAFGKKLVKDGGGTATYDVGTGWQLLYPVDGDDIGWMYNEVNTVAFVVEVNASKQGFQPAYEKWRNSTVTRQRAGWQDLVGRLLTGPQVRGRMIDAETGAPVEGSVYINGVKYTNEKPRRSKNGVYQKILVPGSYELVFKAPGYLSQTVAISVENSAVPLDVHFEKGLDFE